MQNNHSRRSFLKKAGLVTAGAASATTLAAPAVIAQTPVKWRLQTYAGAALGPHVTKPAVDMFNATAKGEMEIELLLRRPARAHRRAVPAPCSAGTIDCSAVRRRFHRRARR